MTLIVTVTVTSTMEAKKVPGFVNTRHLEKVILYSQIQNGYSFRLFQKSRFFTHHPKQTGSDVKNGVFR